MDKDYLVKDYTKVDDVRVKEPSIYIVYGTKSLLETLDKARDEGLKISVYELGECVLDWS